jgi:hypothetical protein
MGALGDLLDVTPVGFLLDFAPNVCLHNDETPKTGLDLTLYVVKATLAIFLMSLTSCLNTTLER